MRIIAGMARGTVLFSPPDLQIRPTTDRAKETLFSILMPRINGSVVLDLFCGSGALGLEALSRGAAKAMFLDIDLGLAKKNGEKTKLIERSEFVQARLPQGLERLAGQKYDLIFGDPPYEKGLAELTLLKISELGLLAPTGWLILEHDRKEKLPQEAGILEKFREKQVGKSKFTFYAYKE